MKHENRKKQFGQGMMEYLIIVAVVAIAAIGCYGFFGKTVRNSMAGLAKEVAGQDSATQITAANTAATGANTAATTAVGLNNYGAANRAK